MQTRTAQLLVCMEVSADVEEEEEEEDEDEDEDQEEEGGATPCVFFLLSLCKEAWVLVGGWFGNFTGLDSDTTRREREECRFPEAALRSDACARAAAGASYINQDRH